MVAAALGLPRRDRRLLGRGLTWTFRPKERTHRAGAPLELVFTLFNGGAEPVEFSKGGTYEESGRDNRFSFAIRLGGVEQPDVGPSMNFDELSTTPVLAPGESSSQTVDLTKWAAFARPGVYEVRARYTLDLAVPHQESSWAWAHQRWDAAAEETLQIVVDP